MKQQKKQQRSKAKPNFYFSYFNINTLQILQKFSKELVKIRSLKDQHLYRTQNEVFLNTSIQSAVFMIVSDNKN